MKKMRLFRAALRTTKADKIIPGFVLFVFVIALIILLVEPDISTYEDALWFCYSVISTAGFGDVIVTTLIGRICAALLTVYAVFVIAIATGVVVSFYNHVVQLRYKESVHAALDKLERLPELSKEELTEISEKIKRMR